MVRASSVERALLFDIVVIEKGCAGGGLGLAVAGSWTCCLCVSGSGEEWLLRVSGAIWGFSGAGLLRDESALK